LPQKTAGGQLQIRIPVLCPHRLSGIPVLQLHLGLAKVDEQPIPPQGSLALQQLHFHLALSLEEALFRQPFHPLGLQTQIIPL